MTIIGIGIDIEDISRFSKKKYEDNKNFYKKIFTEGEIEYCLNNKHIYSHFAVRFCAKEAFIKAINEKIINYRRIEILNNGEEPSIKWKNLNVFLSLTHDREKAVAVVVIERV